MSLTYDNMEYVIDTIDIIAEQVLLSAKVGQPILLANLLNPLTKDQIKYVINKKTEQLNGEKTTALLIASRDGHEKLVKLLLQQTSINTEITGCLIMQDNNLNNEVTALWCAAGRGHLNIVKALVRAGANVNHKTDNQSTPMRAACFDGRLDIVCYLAKHGADVHALNKYRHSCLMVVSGRGYYDIVNFLLNQGVDPNERTKWGSTALHFAAEHGHVDIVKELVRKGAQMFINSEGLTPLLAAAEKTRLAIVEFLLKQTNNKRDKIDALELLGASFANNKENYSLDLAYRFIKQGMELRFSETEVIEKPITEPIAAYRFHKECRTIEDLDRIQNNDDSLHMESLTIRERILGQRNSDVLTSIVYRGCLLVKELRFDFALELLLHASRLAKINKNPVAKDLLRFSRVFAEMYCRGILISFKHLEEVISMGVEEVNTNINKIGVDIDRKDIVNSMKYELDVNILACLHILTLFAKSKLYYTVEEENHLQGILHKLVTNKYAITTRGETLLHFAVNMYTPLHSAHLNESCKYPCAETANLLIKCGANVNTLDNLRNTPLHLIVKCPQTQIVQSIMTNLLEAGAHVDIVNAHGKTPFDCSQTEVADNILLSKRQISLKCLSSCAIGKYNIPYHGILPEILEKFVSLHVVD